MHTQNRKKKKIKVAAHPLSTRGNAATISSKHVILQSSFLFFCFYTESLSISSRKLVTWYQSQMILRINCIPRWDWDAVFQLFFGRNLCVTSCNHATTAMALRCSGQQSGTGKSWLKRLMSMRRPARALTSEKIILHCMIQSCTVIATLKTFLRSLIQCRAVIATVKVL